MSQKPTTQMIAQLCGVSRGTVDRVLYHRGNVRPDIRQRVQNVIDELGYQPPRMRNKSEIAPPSCRIGFLVHQWYNHYFKEQTFSGLRMAEQELTPLGCEIITQEMNSRSIDEYLTRIRSLLKERVDGLILNAGNHEVIQTEIDRAAALGVPVITYDSDIYPSRRICHIGQDVFKCGRVAAGLMATHLTNRDEILIVTGDLSFALHRERVNGFCNRLDELGFHRDCYTIAECYERFDLVSDTVREKLVSRPKLDNIYMAVESVTGCVDGIRKARRPERVHVVCHDMTPGNRQLLESRMVDFILDQTFAMQAYRAARTLFNLLRHDSYPDSEFLYTDIRIVSPELL